MKRRNWRLIASNLREAREQIEAIEALIQLSSKPSDAELAVQLEHAYHHLNFAWNARFTPDSDFRALSDDQFNQWSKYPKDPKPFRITER